MSGQIPTPHKHSDTTAHENGAVLDLSIVTSAWTRAARANCQVELLRNLAKAKTGVAEVEKFLQNLDGAKKQKNKPNKKDTKLLKNIMDRKIEDAEKVSREDEARNRGGCRDEFLHWPPGNGYLGCV